MLGGVLAPLPAYSGSDGVQEAASSNLATPTSKRSIGFFQCFFSFFLNTLTKADAWIFWIQSDSGVFKMARKLKIQAQQTKTIAEPSAIFSCVKRLWAYLTGPSKLIHSISAQFVNISIQARSLAVYSSVLLKRWLNKCGLQIWKTPPSTVILARSRVFWVGIMRKVWQKQTSPYSAIHHHWKRRTASSLQSNFSYTLTRTNRSQ